MILFHNSHCLKEFSSFRKLLVLSGLILMMPLSVFAKLYGDTPDEKHAWAVHDWNRPLPTRVTPAKVMGGAPSDAVVLFDGTLESFKRNWRDKNGKASKWSYSPEGYFYTVPNWKNGGAIYSRAEFGDCQLHIEYRHDPKELFSDKGPQMRGNSGVFLMDNYEIQVLESYHTSKEDASIKNYPDGQAGAVYAENPPLVNPAKPAGEWQVYDIIFHQPVWDGDKLLHPGSVTVLFNGVLVQDHWEMEGLTTHCKRRPLAPHALKGPLQLQDHGCVVQFRNIWYRPLASRWANTTHSSMSAKSDDVMALRRATASQLYAKIPNPKSATAETIKALAEVISYVNEGEYAKDFYSSLEKYRNNPGSKEEVESINEALEILIRCKVISNESKIKLLK